MIIKQVRHLKMPDLFSCAHIFNALRSNLQQISVKHRKQICSDYSDDSGSDD